MYRIGLLAPYRELPGELGDTISAAQEDALHWQVITAAEDSHSIPALRKTGGDDVLRAGVERMSRWRPDVVVWACTSGSFVDGRARALEQVAAIEAVAGVPATSTSLAFAEALAALDIEEVSVIAPYPEQATTRFVGFLGEWGIEVANAVHMDYPSGTASEELRAGHFDSPLAAVGDGLPIVIPDTAVWGLELYRELGPRLPTPLLVANQVTLWHAFQLAGMSTDVESLGALRGCAARGITRSSAN